MELTSKYDFQVVENTDKYLKIKWDDKLPTYLMGNSIPFVNIK